MKTCPRRCGMYLDVETRCPVCGARLFRVNSTNSNNASQSNTAASSNGNGTTAGQKKMGTTTQTQKNGKSKNNMFMPKTTTQTSKTFNASTAQTNTNNVNQLVRSVNSKGNEIHGRITNYREMRDSGGKLRRFFEGMANRGCISLDEIVTNFTVVEIDDSGKQTGVSRNVTFRGQVLGGNLCDNDEVIVKGINDRNGSINATTIYNKSANCKVRLRSGVPWYVFILLFLIIILGVFLIANNLPAIISSVSGIVTCVFSIYFVICISRYVITGHFFKRGHRYRR